MSAPPASILLIEDDPLIRFIVAAALGEEGYSVITATDGGAALALLAGADAPRPSLILLDMLTPAMDGNTFLQRYADHAAPRRAPIVVFTAGPALDQYESPDVVEILRKPFDLGELCAVIGRHVRTSPAAGDVASTD